MTSHSSVNRNKSESGQALAIGAFVLMAAAIAAVVFVQIIQFLLAISNLQEAVQFASEVAARPSGVSLIGGVIKIDETEARIAAEMELERVARQAGAIVGPESFVVEVLNPPDGACLSFPDYPQCFYTPAVRVTAVITYPLLSVSIPITRQGISISSATADSNPRPALTAPTPVVLPTEVFIVTREP